MNDDLLIKYLLKETSPEEDVRVKEWIEESQDNKKYLAQFQKIWDTSKNLSRDSTIDENDAWLRFKEKAANSTASAPTIQSNYFSWLKIAAVLLIAAAGTWSVYSYLLKPVDTTLTAKDEVRTDILPDGSEVTLNKNSVLSYKEFDRNKREVKLQSGEAFFKVRPDRSKPFEITVDNVTVTVLGTSFNVKNQQEKTEVIVESGIVRVSKGKEAVNLYKGEKVNIRQSQDKLVKEINSDKLYNYYRSKEFVANGTPLWRVIEVLNEAYNANIVIQNQSLRELKLTATFKDQSLDNILDIVSKTFDIKVEKTGTQIILK